VQVWCLESQVIHKKNYFEEHVLSRGIPTIILGHSIGAYMTLKALDLVKSARRSCLDNLYKVGPIATGVRKCKQHMFIYTLVMP
jgi:hypothetical protein